MFRLYFVQKMCVLWTYIRFLVLVESGGNAPLIAKWLLVVYLKPFTGAAHFDSVWRNKNSNKVLSYNGHF